ncbi:hypothetical protein ABPG74_016308 [Tetrahymena malaccensis]
MNRPKGPQPEGTISPEEAEKKWGDKFYTYSGLPKKDMQKEINDLEESLESEKIKGLKKFEERFELKKIQIAKSKEHLYKGEENDKKIPVDGDFVEGSRVFMQYCSSCHSLETNNQGRKTTGPALGLIYGRRAGADPYYNYSPSLIKSSYVWTTRNLFYFLQNPRTLISGNKCEIFGGGIKSEEERADLIEFLKVYSKQLSENLRYKANKVYGKDYVNYHLQTQLLVEQEEMRRISLDSKNEAKGK